MFNFLVLKFGIPQPCQAPLEGLTLLSKNSAELTKCDLQGCLLPSRMRDRRFLSDLIRLKFEGFFTSAGVIRKRQRPDHPAPRPKAGCSQHGHENGEAMASVGVHVEMIVNPSGIYIYLHINLTFLLSIGCALWKKRSRCLKQIQRVLSRF
jgi:hypothetical protein